MSMIKKTEILKPTPEYHKFCDDCGVEMEAGGLQCSVARCEYCGKDLCENCIKDEEFTGGDYRIVFCKKCCEIGENYLPKISEYRKQMDALYDEWQSKCKEARTNEKR